MDINLSKITTQKIIEALNNWEPSSFQMDTIYLHRSMIKIWSLLEDNWNLDSSSIDFDSFDLDEAETTLAELNNYLCMEELDGVDDSEPGNEINTLHHIWGVDILRQQLHSIKPLIVEPDYI